MFSQSEVSKTTEMILNQNLIFCFFSYFSDSHPPSSRSNKKFDLPTAASIQAMSYEQQQARKAASKYSSDDLFATEV
jgi:hypothetical protein